MADIVLSTSQVVLVVKNPPAHAGDKTDEGSIPGWGTNIPHAAKQLSPSATTTELVCSRPGSHSY